MANVSSRFHFLLILGSLALIVLVSSRWMFPKGQTSRSSEVAAEKNQAAQPDVQSPEMFNEVVAKGDISRVKQLLANGADPNRADGRGTTPLFLATLKDNVPMMKVLLEAKADPSFRPHDDSSSLNSAVDLGNEQAVALLLQFHVRTDGLYLGRTILHVAIDRGNLPIVKLLVNAGGFDLNAGDYHGKTALRYAIGKGEPFCELLLTKGADPNIVDADGWSPLMSSVQIQNRSLVRQMLDSGADVRHHDRDGWTAYREALVYGCPEILRMLEKAGASE